MGGLSVVFLRGGVETRISNIELRNVEFRRGGFSALLWADHQEFSAVGPDGGGEGFGVGSEVFLAPEVLDLLGGAEPGADRGNINI